MDLSPFEDALLRLEDATQAARAIVREALDDPQSPGLAERATAHLEHLRALLLPFEGADFGALWRTQAGGRPTVDGTQYQNSGAAIYRRALNLVQSVDDVRVNEPEIPNPALLVWIRDHHHGPTPRDRIVAGMKEWIRHPRVIDRLNRIGARLKRAQNQKVGRTDWAHEAATSRDLAATGMPPPSESIILEGSAAALAVLQSVVSAAEALSPTDAMIRFGYLYADAEMTGRRVDHSVDEFSLELGEVAYIEEGPFIPGQEFLDLLEQSNRDGAALERNYETQLGERLSELEPPMGPLLRWLAGTGEFQITTAGNNFGTVRETWPSWHHRILQLAADHVGQCRAHREEIRPRPMLNLTGGPIPEHLLWSGRVHHLWRPASSGGTWRQFGGRCWRPEFPHDASAERIRAGLIMERDRALLLREAVDVALRQAVPRSTVGAEADTNPSAEVQIINPSCQSMRAGPARERMLDGRKEGGLGDLARDLTKKELASMVLPLLKGKHSRAHESGFLTDDDGRTLRNWIKDFRKANKEKEPTIQELADFGIARDPHGGRPRDGAEN